MKHIKLFEEFLNEGIEVNTNKYQGAHGKLPKGNGMWAFMIGGVEEFTPKAMSYADAVKWASKIAKEKELYSIDVLP